MKLTKRILVAVLAFAVIISCFAFGASAEFTEDNIEDILEFYRYPRYLEEDFNGLTVGDVYSLNTSGESFAQLKLTADTARVALDPANAANKVLSYTNSVVGGKYLGYSLVLNKGDSGEMISELVSSVKIRADKAGANASPSFSFNTYAYDELGDPVGEAGLVTLLKLDFESGAVSYSKVNPADATKFQAAPLSGVKVEAGKWYEVSFIIDCNRGTYSFKITADGMDYESDIFSLGEAELINEFNASFSTLPTNSGSLNYIDDIELYRGTYDRGEDTLNEATAKALANIAALIEENEELSLKTALRISAVYEVITNPANGYTPTYTQDFSAATVNKLYNDAKAFISETYTRAFCEATDAISPDRSYSRRERQIALAESYVSLMNDVAFYKNLTSSTLAALTEDMAKEIDLLIAELEAEDTEGLAALEALKTSTAKIASDYLAGEVEDLAVAYEELLEENDDYYYVLDCYYDVEDTILEAVSKQEVLTAAHKKISDEKILLARIKTDSEIFISYMQSYDPATRDYEVIRDLYKKVSTECLYRDNSYNYATTPNVYQFVDSFAKLEAKYNAVVYNVTTFQNAVAAMYKTDEAGNPPVFIDAYNNYVIAKSVYNGGAIHSDIDVSTVSMLELDIARYLAKENELNVAIKVCDDFITKVNNAKEATLYESTKSAINAAKEALLTNGENIIDDYPGVKDAKDSIASIEERIAKLETAAAAYIAAVKAIESDTDRSLAHFTSIVEAARNLSKDGDVVGIDGVSEANKLLSNFEAELDSYNGNSKTLVDAVAKLSLEGISLKERREAIITASAALAGAHDDYNGVKAAKTKLEAAKAEYLEEVSAINAAFDTAIANASAVASSTINQPKYIVIAELVKLLLN